jgi:hypothetical protein
LAIGAYVAALLTLLSGVTRLHPVQPVVIAQALYLGG